MRFLFAWLWLCSPLVVFALAHASGAAEPAELTAAQRKAASAIAVELRKAKTPEARVALIDRAALEVAPVAVEPLAEIVVKELHISLAGYRNQFMKAAAASAEARITPAAIAEITDLRGKIQGVLQQEELTKEMIVETSDRALARLKEIVLVDREEVLKGAPELVKRRAAFEPIGRQWEACAKYLQATESGKPPLFETYLAKEEEIAAALAMPMDRGTREIFAANARLADQLDPEEARCMLDLNLTRALIGLSPLAIDPALVACARDHSQDMVKHKFFSHESPVPGKKTFGDRAKLFNTSMSGENIAAGAVDGAAANTQWWHSPGHHKNMLGGHKRVGVGRAGRVWTEAFGG